MFKKKNTALDCPGGGPGSGGCGCESFWWVSVTVVPVGGGRVVVGPVGGGRVVVGPGGTDKCLTDVIIYCGLVSGRCKYCE